MKTKLKRTILAFVALGAACTVHAQKLVIKGSDTLGAKLVPILAEEYRATNKQVLFEIAAEGSSTGIAAIIEGNANIGMSSRRAKAPEIASATAKGVRLKPTVVAYDGIAVVVNKANPVANLTKRQIERIFTGDVADWAAVGGTPGAISLYTRNTASGTYADWQEMAMRKRDYAKSSQKMAGNEQIIAEVSRNPAGIGYVGLAYTNAPGVKVVAIGGSVPTKANVLAGSYPYARPTFFYTNGDPAGETERFVEFTLGKRGQAIVEKTGFVPVK
ncbi:MAG: phosphate ABC transporter substrate-binding protein [Puniceicoccales bacterium]|jgi:phosphate transport system substrate-binding protein|nr:phosphate ABC transporter substrate-binding protein [Puniceicoccales bacterium]